MPPKPRFTKEEVVNVALELVSEKGIEALTARGLGARLGSSARPIFTVFKNMEELQQEVRKAALKRYEGFVQKAINYTSAFKQFGMQMILFAMEEPKLYQHVWIHAFGIGALCASRVCQFSENEITEMLGHDFIDMLMLIKSGRMNQPTVQPVPKVEDK